MLLVIRCPKCRGASRVDEPDLGQTVQCPRCADAFTAIEEAELVAPGPRARGAGFDPPSRRSPEPPSLEDDTPPPAPPPDRDAEPATHPEAEFDPHREPPGSLPASVLVGLALLPFLIPILWLIAPAVTGVEPVLSLGSALALAVSASVLCLAVIYTVDWRPSTRIRGVLLLVVLSYATGVTLYLMKKEWVDRVKRFFGVELPWVESAPPGGVYRVRLPAMPEQVKGEKPLAIVAISCEVLTHTDGLRQHRFVVGSSLRKPVVRPFDPALGTDDWFKVAKADIALEAQTKGPVLSRPVKYKDRFPGLELQFPLQDRQVRVARVFVVNGRVYYLAIDGTNLTADDDIVERFFGSFEVLDAP